MTKRIRTDEIIPDDIVIGGRSYVHEWQARRRNRQTLAIWRYRLRTLALSCFEWEGVPPTLDARAMEVMLLDQGCGGFFDMGEGAGLWAFCPATPMGNLNLYYNPNKVMLQPPNGGRPWYRHAWFFAKAAASGALVHAPDAILCFDNLDRYPLGQIIDIYARRLAKIDRVIDQHVAAQAVPWVMTCPDEARKDAYNTLKMILGDEPAIIGSHGMRADLSVNVLKTDVDFKGTELFDLQSSIVNTFLTIIGVNNANTDKRERLITDEANANNDEISILGSSRQRCRVEFCDKVCARFGVDMRCYFVGTKLTARDILAADMIDGNLSNDVSGGDEDGGDMEG